MYTSGSTELIPRATVEELCGHGARAMDLYREGLALLAAARKAHDAAAPGVSTLHGLPDDLHRQIGRGDERADEMLSNIQKGMWRDMWSSLLTTTPLWSLLDEQERRAFEASLRDSPPPCTPDNIQATVTRLSAESPAIFRRGLVNAFRWLCRDYRSNNGFSIGARMVITHGVDRYSSGSFSVNYHKQDVFRDLDRVMHVLDGKKEPDYQNGLCAAMRVAFGEKRNPHELETPYWKLRWFGNGNVHLWPIRADLVDRANKMIAEHYGLVLGSRATRESRLNSPPPNWTAPEGNYPSPPDVVDAVMARADVREGMMVLEPSAGAGNLARACAQAGAFVTCVELWASRADQLREAGLGPVIVGDFLAVEPEPKFQRVVMNPPFGDGADIYHVIHASKFVAPGGILVAVMPTGWRHNTHRLSTEFREWVSRRGAEVIQLPPGSFQAAGTGVSTCIVAVSL